MSKYEVYHDEIKRLHAQGLQNGEIAKKIGIDSRRISERLKVLGLVKNERTFKDQPTKDEELIFRSLFLGDGAIYKSEGNVNYRVNLAHSPKQKEYFMMKYNRVKNFIGTTYWKETQLHTRVKKEYHAYKFQSLVNPYFTRMRKKWYKDGKKIIPKDIKDFLDEELLAYKFFDDGSIDGSGYNISMCDYDSESVELFRKALLNNFNIKTNLHGSYENKNICLYVPAKERTKFRNIVEPYATSDVLYKLGEFKETLNK